MPNPVQSELHVNVPLTNISVAWLQSEDAYIADKVFPKVPVQKQSDLYWKYVKNDWRRTDVQRRAPSTESPGTGWRTSVDSYFCHVYAVHKDIDDQLRSNADSVFKLDSDATKFITGQMLLKRDQDWSQSYFRTGVWDLDLTGKPTTPGAGEFLQWDQAAATPIEDVNELLLKFRERTGEPANVMVMGPYVYNTLINNADILERIKYTQRGIVTADLIASLFGIDRILINYATTSSTVNLHQNQTLDDEGDFHFLHSARDILIANTPSSPSLLTPAAGYTFTWSGYLGGNDEGIRIKRFRMEQIASDRVEAEMTYDQRVISKEMGVFLKDVVGA